MSEESEGARGAEAWQAQRAAIAKRNLEARKRGQSERRARERAVELREQVEATRERRVLDELNAANATRGET